MTRCSEQQLTRRINGTLALLRKYSSIARVVLAVVRQYQVSRQQAYRYVQQAKQEKQMLPIPERKVVFTVKLPLSLVHRLRQRTKLKREFLSAFVTMAIETFLEKEEHG